MDAADNFRLFWVHKWLVVALSLLGALLVFLGLTLLSPQYTSTATLRVVPPTGTLDTAALDTAVSWYAALGGVPSVLTAAGQGVRPVMAEAEVAKATLITNGKGPGEILVTATLPDQAQAQALATSLSQVVLARVANDPELKLGNTTLQLLVPASPAVRAGAKPLVVAVATFLLLFALLATLVAVFGRRINWRLSRAAAAELAGREGLPAFPLASAVEGVAGGSMSAAAFLSPVLAEESVSVVPTGSWGSSASPAEVLAQALRRLGQKRPVVEATGSTRLSERTVIYSIAATGSAALAHASSLGVPVVLAVPPRARARTVNGFIGDLRALELDILCVVLLDADTGRRGAGTVRTQRPAPAPSPAASGSADGP